MSLAAGEGDIDYVGWFVQANNIGSELNIGKDSDGS